MHGNDQVLEVWGELACFTRPEMKVERFSYPIITPSASRGIFDAIYCKPSKDPAMAEFRWQITRIELLAPPAYIALRRNEVKEKASVGKANRWMEGTADPEPLLADADSEAAGSDAKGRTQRQTMALRDVRYRLHAHIVPWPGHEHRLSAIEAQFKRRAETGKCIHQPYFGCREFPAFFQPGVSSVGPHQWDADLGWMLYDVFDLSRPGTPFSGSSVSLFHARVSRGVLDVPPYESDLVRKAEGGPRPC